MKKLMLALLIVSGVVMALHVIINIVSSDVNTCKGKEFPSRILNPGEKYPIATPRCLTAEDIARGALVRANYEDLEEYERKHAEWAERVKKEIQSRKKESMNVR